MAKDPPLPYLLLFSYCYSVPVTGRQRPERPGRCISVCSWNDAWCCQQVMIIVTVNTLQSRGQRLDRHTEKCAQPQTFLPLLILFHPSTHFSGRQILTHLMSGMYLWRQKNYLSDRHVRKEKQTWEESGRREDLKVIREIGKTRKELMFKAIRIHYAEVTGKLQQLSIVLTV